MTLSSKQTGVLRGIFLGAAITVIGIIGVGLWQPGVLVPEDDIGTRLAYALKWDVLLLIVLAISIGILARHRFFTPEDIDGGGLTSGTPKAHAYQCILQNTLEQVVLAIGVHLVWAVSLPVGWLVSVPAAAVLFVVGRILFITGYERGAPARALGFAMTFYPSVLMLIIILVNALMSRQS